MQKHRQIPLAHYNHAKQHFKKHGEAALFGLLAACAEYISVYLHALSRSNCVKKDGIDHCSGLFDGMVYELSWPYKKGSFGTRRQTETRWLEPAGLCCKSDFTVRKGECMLTWLCGARRPTYLLQAHACPHTAGTKAHRRTGSVVGGRPAVTLSSGASITERRRGSARGSETRA